MKTDFTIAQLADPEIDAANTILRNCVHCGFCTATCPTYVLLGDELDSPRGRIYLIKNLLEQNKPATNKVVKHIDRCLSCLSCMTTCPASVDYMHLVDRARAHIFDSFSRPWADQMLRVLLALVVPNPGVFRWALIGARLARPFRALFPGRLKGLIGMAPKKIAKASLVDRAQVFACEGKRCLRVALMTGCAQQVLRPAINEATVRLLTRHGCEVVVASGAGCCGALVHHMGREIEARIQAKTNIGAWEKVIEDGGLDAIVINASGCGTTVKDYGWLLKDEPDWAERAKTISALTRDVSEVVTDLDLKEFIADTRPVVAYHSACSMQHGQKLTDGPKNLLTQAGFEVVSPGEGHLCCGSAGTYNILQPEIATRLQERKIGHLKATGADVIATGNIGCLVQIAGGDWGKTKAPPVVHTVELLDWATGGPKPSGLP
ncbi:MAG: glycolate oxidase subunit GlcF [Proteobacteria bacterium]|nr:glycolate oxidase subunit GlcF [Pseudomonadota bacterium]MDA1021966.1 glycolate oxidase subunit GlcF [Pseudomonadota bacterium]